MLAIEVELLTGRYIATRYNDRTRAEWPPHPARLFSALVATHYAQEIRDSAERAALEWLECQGSPHLRASTVDEISERDAHTVFVPVNDAYVTGDFEEEQQALAQAESEAEALIKPGEAPKRGSPGAKALGRVEKLRTSLAERVRKGISPFPADKVPPKDAIDRAEGLFPERRMRQPRSFPSVWPSEDRVFFIWPEALPEKHLPALESLIGRVVRLGHSSSMVRVGLIAHAPEPNWRPDPSGSHRLRVVRKGQLASLDEAFALHKETNPRVLPFAVENYATGGLRVPQSIHRSQFASDWVVLRRTAGPMVPSTASASVAKTVRRALMSFAEQPAPEIITGHAPGGAPATKPHLAIVPLPFVGHAQADGGLLGIALVLPNDVSDEDRRAVFHALAGWEKKGIREEGSPPIIPLHLGAAGTLQLERLEETASQATLRSRTWCGPSKKWATATPVALDRNPGELRDRDPSRAALAAKEAEATVIAALQRIGISETVRVTISPHAPLAGGRKAKWFPPYPENVEKTRRVLTHVEIEFETEVEGPLLLGSGRYHGLGLFKPVVNRG